MRVNKQTKRPASAKLSRKQLRKELRKQKKVRRNEYYTNRNKSGKFVRNPDLTEPPKITHANNTIDISDGKCKGMLKSHGKNKPQAKALSSEDLHQKALQKEKKEHEKLKKEMAHQRKEQLQKANDEEDRNIRRLEKQLGLNKRKAKGTPKSFSADGLDYLLEVCDSDNMKTAVEVEQQIVEAGDGFEEDLALMTGVSMEKKKKVVDAKGDQDSDNLGCSDSENSFKQGQSDEEMEFSDGESDEIADVASDNDEKELSSDSNGIGSESVYDESSDEDDDEKKDEVWEDIYGRLRGKNGEIIVEDQGKYIPPAIRAKMEAEAAEKDGKRNEKLSRLRRQLKGLLNRLAESNMHSIASQIEELYMNNSRNDMNDTLITLILDSVVISVLTPERLLLEHVLLVTILHANVGTEVGAHFLQTVVKKFDQLFRAEHSVENKMLDNVVWIIAQLYNYKVFHAQLIYEVLEKLSKRFTEADIECILLILKNVGFSLRKDDPLALKNLILSLQKQANNATADTRENPRVKFMLDILLAVKNNNMSKIPNYDTSYAEHLKKLLKGLVRKGCYVTTLNISLEDLLKVDECGKWWVVGSAWTGKIVAATGEAAAKPEGFSQKLLDLARKQRMNTDTRRNIFCIIMSAEDYLDTFEKLLHLGLKGQQELEIMHVLLHCCLQEGTYNPYYAVLAQKFCEYDRKFQITIKYSVWDKLKALTQCSGSQLSNLAKLLTHLFLEKGLPISTLKIVQFGELDKITLRFMRQILIGILLADDAEACHSVFANIAQSEKLRMFRESLRLFIRHFLLRNLKSEAVAGAQKILLEDRAKMIDRILSAGDKKVKF